MKGPIMIPINSQVLQIDGLASESLKELVPARGRGCIIIRVDKDRKICDISGAVRIEPTEEVVRLRDAHSKRCQERLCSFVVEASTVDQDRV